MNVNAPGIVQFRIFLCIAMHYSLAKRERILTMQKPSKRRAGRLPRGLAIIYEDSDLLVVDKPSGLLTVGTDTEKSRTAYFMLTDYVRKGNAKSRKHIFIVHRLDRDASGIIIFAKNAAAKHRLQSQWNETKKKYIAVVHGKFTKHSDVITSYLAENKAHIVYSTPDTTKGKLSHTGYKVLKTTKDFSLLEIDLLTGRKHQIRVHLADIGHPIVGDKKYGNVDRTHKRLALHASSIFFNHPGSGEPCTFESTVPVYFTTLVGRFKSE